MCCIRLHLDIVDAFNSIHTYLFLHLRNSLDCLKHCLQHFDIDPDTIISAWGEAQPDGSTHVGTGAETLWAAVGRFSAASGNFKKTTRSMPKCWLSVLR